MLVVLWAAFGLAACWVVFAYLGYPLGLMLLRRWSPIPSCASSCAAAPSVSIIIAVHNGASELATKLRETLDLPYDGPREILVTSDGSTDGTAEIARRFADRGVRLLESPARAGKEAAQARAIDAAGGEILVFTDVGTRLERDALRQLVTPFSDPSIGAVSSEDAVSSEQGEGLYVRYEMALRNLESQAATLVGCSGSLFAIRRELAKPWPTDLASDFRSALETCRRGFRAVNQTHARASYAVVHDPQAEWRRKVRTVRRGLAVLWEYRELMHPRHGRVAYALIGHKLARFTSPFALMAALLISSIGAPWSPAFAWIAGLQVAVYALGIAALWMPALARPRIPRTIGFFLLVNASVITAWMYHLTGHRAVTWTPTQRSVSQESSAVGTGGH